MGGTAADEVLKQAGQPGGSGEVEGGGDQQGGEAGSGVSAAGSSSNGGAQAGAANSNADQGPDAPTKTVKGCEDTDKVARQLCEAATEEKDPFLRASLWKEYNEYKKILARQ